MELGSLVLLLCPVLWHMWKLPLSLLGWGPKSWIPPQLEGWGHRPHCWCSFTLALSAPVVGKSESWAPPATIGFSGALWLAAVAREQGICWDCRHHFCCFSILPPLWVPIHPLLDEKMCGILWYPGVFGRGTLLSCRCFTGYKLKGRNTRSISLCHDANVIPIP